MRRQPAQVTNGRSRERQAEKGNRSTAVPACYRAPVRHYLVAVVHPFPGPLLARRLHGFRIAYLSSSSGAEPFWTDFVGVFPDEAALVRLAGSIPIEQNDVWAVVPDAA